MEHLKTLNHDEMVALEGGAIFLAPIVVKGLKIFGAAVGAAAGSYIGSEVADGVVRGIAGGDYVNCN